MFFLKHGVCDNNLWLICTNADAVEGLLLTAMVVVAERSGWTTFSAVVRKQASHIVDTEAGAHTTVITEKTSLSRATRLSVSLYYYKRFAFRNTQI